MNSIDANILVYAFNEEAEEHPIAKSFIEQAMDHPNEWFVSDQTLLEFYSVIRNPVIMKHPLGAREACSKLQFVRSQTGFLHCSYESTLWPSVMQILSKAKFPYRRTFDAVLAATLIGNGVEVLYTRNTKDFHGFGFKVINPID